MAKNKKQDRRQSQSERGQQQTRPSPLESHAEQQIAQVTPADVPGKSRQKRFGHN
jgi:hypothetical protein